MTITLACTHNVHHFENDKMSITDTCTKIYHYILHLHLQDKETSPCIPFCLFLGVRTEHNLPGSIHMYTTQLTVTQFECHVHIMLCENIKDN